MEALANEYVYEVLDFLYPKQEILEYALIHEDWKPNIWYTAANVDLTQAKWWDYYPSDDCPIIGQVSSSIKAELPPGSYKLVKTLKGGHLPYHIDPQRECVFMLPLTDDNSGIEWIDANSNVIYKHTYVGPTVINAKIKHGVPYVDKDRYFLQVNLPVGWNELSSELFK